jgi:hypothetical protein
MIPTALPGEVRGKIALQGTQSVSGVTVENDRGQMVALDGEARFALTLAPGEYTFTARRAGFLTARRVAVTVASGETVRLPGLMLTAGDANGDQTIDIADVVLVAGSFQSEQNPAADLNLDGLVNILDLVLVNSNFGKSGAENW